MPDNHAVLIALLFAAFFGAFIGSFLNVCIHRMPRNESIVSPGSRCYSCGTHVQWYDNIPILSYLILNGKCRWCGASFSVRYVLMEVLVALISVLGVWWCLQHINDGGMNFIAAFSGTTDTGNWIVICGHVCFVASVLCLMYYLFVSSVIDIDHRIIPDELTKGYQFIAPLMACTFPVFLNGPYLVNTAPTIIIDNQPYIHQAQQAGVPAEIVKNQLMLNASFAIEKMWSITAYYFIVVGLIVSFVLCLPIAKKVYTSMVPEEQRWKDQDARAYNWGLWVFLISIFIYIIVLAACEIFLDPQLTKENFPWYIFRWSMMEAVLGALIGWALPFWVGIFGSIVFKRGAMGYGDVKFLAPIGALLGPIAIVEVFFVAALIGTALGIPALLMNKQLEIPFGPYLAAGAVVTLLWGSQIASLMLPGFFA